MLFSDASMRCSKDNLASSTNNASSYCFAEHKPFPSSVIAKRRAFSVSGRPKYVFQHAHPSAHSTAPP